MRTLDGTISVDTGGNGKRSVTSNFSSGVDIVCLIVELHVTKFGDCTIIKFELPDCKSALIAASMNQLKILLSTDFCPALNR